MLTIGLGVGIPVTFAVCISGGILIGYFVGKNLK